MWTKVYNVLLWTLQLVLLTGGSVQKYDISTYSDETISMDYDQINAVDVLMYMTADLVPRRESKIHIKKYRDTDKLHFYFSEINMASCQDISLHISTGNSTMRLSPYTGLPSVCGPMAHKLANVHHTSSDKHLMLELTWSDTTRVRGIVFRFVANVYNCRNCTKAEQCGNRLCVHPDIKRENNYDFCDDSIVCDDALTELQQLIVSVLVISIIAAGAFMVICVPCIFCCCCRGSRECCEDCCEDCGICECLGECLECCCGVIGQCCRRIPGCLRGVRHRTRKCYTRVSEHLHDWYHQGQEAPGTIENPTTPNTTEMVPITILERPPERLVPRDTYMVPATLPVEDDAVPYSDYGVSEEGEEGAPPSYAAAMAMPRRKTPTAPSCDLPPSDAPPEYSSLVSKGKMSNL